MLKKMSAFALVGAMSLATVSIANAQSNAAPEPPAGATPMDNAGASSGGSSGGSMEKSSDTSSSSSMKKKHHHHSKKHSHKSM